MELMQLCRSICILGIEGVEALSPAFFYFRNDPCTKKNERGNTISSRRFYEHFLFAKHREVGALGRLGRVF